MARPSSPCLHRKVRVISFRVTFTEQARLEFNAASQILSVSQHARGLVLDTATSPVIEFNSRVDPALIAQIHKIGINLNQLCKNAHIFGRVSPQVEALCVKIQHLLVQSLREDC